MDLMSEQIPELKTPREKKGQGGEVLSVCLFQVGLVLQPVSQCLSTVGRDGKWDYGGEAKLLPC